MQISAIFNLLQDTDGNSVAGDRIHRERSRARRDRGIANQMSRNVVAVKWIKGKGSIGIVLVKSEYSGYKAYIGVALDVNEDYDIEYIIAWGSLLPRTIAAAYYPKLIKEGIKYDGKTTITRRKSRKNVAK